MNAGLLKGWGPPRSFVGAGPSASLSPAALGGSPDGTALTFQKEGIDFLQLTRNDPVQAPTGYVLTFLPTPDTPTLLSQFQFVYAGDVGQNSQRVNYRNTLTGGTQSLSRNTYLSYQVANTGWFADDPRTAAGMCSDFEMGQGDVAFFVAPPPGSNVQISPFPWNWTIEFDGANNSGNALVVTAMRTRIGSYTGTWQITTTRTGQLEVIAATAVQAGYFVGDLGATQKIASFNSQAVSTNFAYFGTTANFVVQTSTAGAVQSHASTAGNPSSFQQFDGPDGGNATYVLTGIDPTGNQTGFGVSNAGISTGANGTGTNRPLLLHTFGAADAIIATNNTERLRVFGVNTGSQGVGTMKVANATTTPTANPSGGGLLYANAGAGTWRGSSGTTTTFGPAEPHCPDCGRDFACAWENPRYGRLEVCMWCVIEQLVEGGLTKGIIHREKAAA